MDEYLKLNWFRNTQRTEKEKFDFFSIDFDKQRDIFHHTLNEIDSVHEVSKHNSSFEACNTEIPLDPRTQLVVENLVIDTTKKFEFFDQFPAGSSLSKTEHRNYLQKLENSLDVIKDGGEISEKLEQEREKFNEFVKNYFLSNLLHRKQIVDDNVQFIAKLIWKNNVEKLSIDESYSIMASLPLDLGENIERSLKFVKHFEEYGNRRQLNSDALLHSHSIKRNKHYLENMCLYSADPSYEANLTKLLESNEIDYCIPVSSLCLLMKTLHKGDQNWFLPIIVKQINDKMLIHFRESCPPLTMNTTEINKIGFKAFIESFAKYDEELDLDLLEISGNNYNGTYKVQNFDDFLSTFKADEKKFLGRHRNRNIQKWITNGYEETNILIENDIDCWISNENINLSIKLEYQSEFGLEKMTENELIEEWCRQYFNPGSKTLRLRIDFVSKAIISYRYLTLENIESEAKNAYALDFENLLCNMLVKIKIFKNFPFGNYLLKFEPTKSNQIMIYKGSTCLMNTLNLKELFKNIDYERTTLDDHVWNPIDFFELAPYHINLGIIPGTFPHWIVKKSLISRNLKPMMKAENIKQRKVMARKEKEQKFKAIKKSQKKLRKRKKKRTEDKDSLNFATDEKSGQLHERVF